ncbi:GntR family transcriptional regulator [Rhizobium sp. CSW-27]|uniref:GntR family transcriptional regulator n=1 Tax=Rhizobium sp. CSW-27 TaxID=2839985 RepID=UPI002078C9F9|nr:GntR family transcriptional regulator [Rhizobium sp. CSW-27]
MEPQWFRVYQAVKKAILVGELQAGSKVPPEFDLSEEYGVSRNTVRRAYLALSQEGLIRSVNGRGSFVMQRGMTYEVEATSRFRDVLDRQGVRSAVRILESEYTEADEDIARILKVKTGHPLLRATDLILGDEVPFILTVRHIRADLIDDLERKLKEANSLTLVARREGLGQLRRVSTTVEARLPTEREASLLQSPANAPVLLVHSTGGIDNGILLECQKAVMNSQRIRLSFRSADG